MILIPQNYSDWVKILELLKNKSDDVEVLNAMKAGKIEWQSGVAERFLKRLTDSVNFRLNNATDKFQKEISRSGSESNIVQSVINLRKELIFLFQAVDLSAIPEKQRAQLVSMILGHKPIKFKIRWKSRRKKTEAANYQALFAITKLIHFEEEI